MNTKFHLFALSTIAAIAISWRAHNIELIRLELDKEYAKHEGSEVLDFGKPKQDLDKGTNIVEGERHH